ncbi:McrB family protein [Adhaeribacter rhizoryzae]|uniref:AAA domain-containing protein n=1 Tax=Adhaeribacter rhizoryzae TaxID=2607907 RepID=A0A5M6DKP5_9BACT|nr:AAA family ATPase [Adhaeribacter rhizoryzae]KAA5548088.1 AAA domain-containing protein [Adhaeribacter rhizoryzae]
MPTFFAKITIQDQYDPSTASITWRDPLPERWNKTYSKLQIGDKGFFIGKGFVYLGVLKSVVEGDTLVFGEVEPFELRSDNFLSIHAISPEVNAQLKGAIKQPYIFSGEINYEDFRQAALAEYFIKFYIVKSVALEKYTSTFHNNDRVITLNDDLVFENFGVYQNDSLAPLEQDQHLFNVKGKSIYEVIQIFEQANAKKTFKTGSSNLTQLHRIRTDFENGKNLYQFSSFSSYYNIIHNKTALVYSKVELLNYYLVGSSWDKEDQTERFLAEGIWQNANGLFKEQVKSIPVGSMIAIKSVYTERRTDSVMRIKARGEVTGNANDGENLKVKWEENFESFVLPSNGYWTTVHKVTKPEHIQAIFFNTDEPLDDEPDDLIEVDEKPEMRKVELPLNLILYGPPGTGKTYRTTEYAMSILEGGKPEDYESNFGEDAIEKRRALQNKFNTYLKNGRAEFITFHQSYGYEDFVVGIKPKLDGDSMAFKRHEGVFYKICQRARENYLKASKQPERIQVSFDEVFEEVLKPLENNNPVVIANRKEGYSFKITKRNEFNLDFEKQNGGTSHKLSISTLKDVYEGTRSYLNNGLGVYIHPFVKHLKEAAQAISATAKYEPLQTYVLIIDEINRANISRVLGELITLLEPDKRLGGLQELEIKLSNGESFSVPPNLYIIGTMNTADKSIALLDIALRRRFVFKELLPDVTAIKDANIQSFFTALNQLILKKKGKDFLIGHSYFMNAGNNEVDLIFTMNHKVLPLLAEYFYNKEQEMLTLVQQAISDSTLKQLFVATAEPSGFNKVLFDNVPVSINSVDGSSN